MSGPATFQGLVDAHVGIGSLTAAAGWATAAEAYLERLKIALQGHEQAVADRRDALSRANAEANNRPAWKRLLKTSDQKDSAKLLREAEAALRHAIEANDTLQDLIDNTPTNAIQARALVNELKAAKKELQIDKRQVTAQLRDIRADARRKSTDAATGLLATATGRKFTAAERRYIHSAKELALAKPEEMKAAIERRLISLDRQIAKLESFY
jgi:DNA repair ATPase RecN